MMCAKAQMPSHMDHVLKAMAIQFLFLWYRNGIE